MRSPKAGPVPPAKKPAKAKPARQRGRPQHVPTEDTIATVMRLNAIGHSNEEIAAAVGIDGKTLIKHYGTVIKTAKMVIRAAAVNALFKSANSGNVSAQKKVIEMTGDDADYRIPDAPAVVEDKAPKVKPLGKKEALAVAAANPDTSTSMGALMAARNRESDTAH